ncbi:MAG: hypothetical protein JWR09_478 [Mucilaginibacter sp.]|nr:hypothetical protein [Mucilaginibacter sp.]
MTISFLLAACRHNAKTGSSVIKAVTLKPILKTIVKTDTPLICVDYAEIGSFDPEKEPFKEFEEKRKSYFKGKTELSDDYVIHYLFSGLDSISRENIWDGSNLGKTELLEYISKADFYLIGTALKNTLYTGIIYEELTDEESTKYFSTFDKKGKFISRVLIAEYGQSGTYRGDNDSRHPYYTGINGCINKNLTIEVNGADGVDVTRDNGKYKIQFNGKIVKVIYWNDRDPTTKEYYDSLLKVNPNNAKYHFDYACMLSNQYNEYSNARKEFEKTLQLDPNFAEAYHTYAFDLYNKFNDTVKANHYFEKSIKIAPNVAQYHSDYAYFLSHYLKDTINAKRQYQKAVELAPHDAQEHLGYANFLYEYLKNTKEARQEYIKAIKLNPNLKSKDDDHTFEVK